MTCEQRKDRIPLLPLGSLDPEEARELRGHLAAGCPVCEGQLAEADALLSLLPMALPPVLPPIHVKQRLLSRVQAELPRPSGAAGWKIGPALFGLAAGIIIAAGLCIVLLGSQRRAGEALRGQLALKNSQLSQKDSQIEQLQADVHFMQDAVHTVTSPTVQVVGLQGKGQPGARGIVYVDRSRRKLLFSTDGLKSLPSSKTYELWLVSGDKKIPVGTFNSDANGEAALALAIPSDIGPLAAAAVTDEPAGGLPQPTGSFQLLGAVTQ